MNIFPFAVRAVSQLLHRPALGGVVEVVRRLLAVQAQDVAAFPLAFRARMDGVTRDEVDAVREERSVLRCWGPRGTLHLVAVEDAGWFLPLVRGTAAASLRRLRELGRETSYEDALCRVGRALDGQGPLTKAELGARLGEEGQAIVHFAALGAHAGLVVLGPERGGKPTYVHTVDWLGAPLPEVPADGEKALRELVLRYRRAHHPCAPEDLALWSGLPLRAVQRAWREIPEPSVPEVPSSFVRLLPAYDEYLLGWGERPVPEVRRRAVHPGGGVLRPVVIADGRIVGIWPGGRLELWEPVDCSAELADIARFREPSRLVR
ncbi:winged helix DNA-binding domain-containing protein [Actinocorallia populi]|uniref:winged helix DNA-binding domain-containing protein n=1 Tax=Actinocorallia populi TaxID=2079200 RepID=UPI000D08A6F4|nr:winged helix DNA-binding domain-containing protein [Actinocorallia populi]